MASPNLGITHITAGQNNKEATANAAVDALDNSTNAIATVTFASDADDTMTAAEWTDSKVIRIAGSITAARVMTVPATARHVEIWNDTGQTVTIRSASPSDPIVDVEVAAGARVGIASDGADIYEGAAGSGGGLADGDYGDITVSSGGTVFTIDALAVTSGKIAAGAVGLVKLADIAEGNVIGRAAGAGTGTPATLDGATARTTLGAAALTPSVNAQTGTTYTLVLGDAGGIVTMSNAGANTLTIPTNASVAFPTGTVINVVMLGAGQTTVAGDTGVTVNGVSAGSGDLSAQYAAVALLKIGTDTWVASGGIGAVA